MEQTFELDEWQKKVLDTKGNIALRSGRQVGKSTAISILAGDFAAMNENKVVMIIAAVERQAYLLFEKCLYYMEKKHRRMILQGSERPTKTEIRLSNGSKLYCLPSGLTGYGIRGFTIDLLIADEAAFIPDEVFNAVTPAMAARKGARMVLLSTPFGRKGYFANAFNDPTFTTFHVSSEECPRISKEFLAQEKARLSKLVYMQEYMGEFVDELLQWFPDELIKKCMNMKRPERIATGERHFLGVDLARMGDDASTFAIGKLRGDRITQVEHQITTRTYLTDSTKHIIELDNRYDFEKIYIDDEGIGIGVVDMLIDNDQTKNKIIPINNSTRINDAHDEGKVRLLKEDLYTNLLVMMQNGKIDLLDDPEIYQSLKSVQYEYSSDTKGKPILKIFGNWTHTAESLIRLAWCIERKEINIGISWM
jgi:hypothetical protein